jgi:WD40 repeat protein
METGHVHLTFTTPSRVLALAFSPDGTRLVGVLSDGLRVWDAATGRGLLQVRQPPGSSTGSVAFSSDGNWIVSRGAGGVWIWDGTPAPMK